PGAGGDAGGALGDQLAARLDRRLERAALDDDRARAPARARPGGRAPGHGAEQRDQQDAEDEGDRPAVVGAGLHALLRAGGLADGTSRQIGYHAGAELTAARVRGA